VIKTDTDDFDQLDGQTFLDAFEDEPILQQIQEPTKDELKHLVYEKKSKSSYNMNTTTTLKRPRFSVPSLTASIEDGGMCCSGCGKNVPHDDYVGEHKGDCFKVVGYHCQSCDHRWVRDKYAEEEKRSSNKYMTMGKWDVSRNF
jgi:hypothetical protein